MTKKSKIQIINGIKFRPGSVEWADHYGYQNAQLPDFTRADLEYIGTKITTTGLVGRINKKYIIVITEQNTEEGEDKPIYDYTLIVLKPKITVTYH